MDESRSVQQGGSVILLRENVEEYQDLVRDVATAPGLNPLLAAVTRKISAAMVSHLVPGSLLACPQLPPDHLRPGSLAPNLGDHGPSDAALAAASDWRLRQPAADRHAARCASRDLCSGARPSAPCALGRASREIPAARAAMIALATEGIIAIAFGS